MRLWAIIVIIIGNLIVLPIMFQFGADIPVKEQMAIVGIVINLSSILFGILGLWIAILFPQALLVFSKKDTKDDREGNLNKCRELIIALFISVGIVCFSLTIVFLRPVIKQIPFFVENIQSVKGLLFCLSFILVEIQLIVLIMLIIPGVVLFDEMKLRNKVRKLHDQLVLPRKKTCNNKMT